MKIVTLALSAFGLIVAFVASSRTIWKLSWPSTKWSRTIWIGTMNEVSPAGIVIVCINSPSKKSDGVEAESGTI
ncbi:hypothetical protein D3C83_60870 [compost metagenome]